MPARLVPPGAAQGCRRTTRRDRLPALPRLAASPSARGPLELYLRQGQDVKRHRPERSNTPTMDPIVVSAGRSPAIDPDRRIRSAAFAAIEKTLAATRRTDSLGRHQAGLPYGRRNGAVRQSGEGDIQATPDERCPQHQDDGAAIRPVAVVSRSGLQRGKPGRADRSGSLRSLAWRTRGCIQPGAPCRDATEGTAHLFHRNLAGRVPTDLPGMGRGLPTGGRIRSAGNGRLRGRLAR